MTQDIIASPKGPFLQFVPGALLDRSWPKASVDALRRGGLPGMVAEKGQQAHRLDGRIVLTGVYGHLLDGRHGAAEFGHADLPPSGQ